MRNPRLRRRRKRPDASYSPLAAPGATETTRAVQRLIAAESARTTLTDAEIDAAAIITPEDEERAVALWDEAQREADTGLEGLLEARQDDGATRE